jgi:hypothetical protein
VCLRYRVQPYRSCEARVVEEVVQVGLLSSSVRKCADQSRWNGLVCQLVTDSDCESELFACSHKFGNFCIERGVAALVIDGRHSIDENPATMCSGITANEVSLIRPAPRYANLSLISCPPNMIANVVIKENIVVACWNGHL